MSRFEDEEFLPWYRRATAGWLELSAAARGVLVSIEMELNPKRGDLVLRRGLRSLEILLRIPWETLEPALAELIASGKLAWDGSNFVLSDPEYAERRRRTSADRMAAKRARDKRPSEPPPSDAGDASDVTSVTAPPSDACDAPSYLISSSLLSSDLLPRSDLPPQSPRARLTEPAPPPEGPPDWWAAAVATAEMGLGGPPIADVPARWLEYRASRERRGEVARQGDAAGWLVTCVRRERAEAARRPAKAQRQPLGSAADAPWMRAEGSTF